MAVRTRRKPGQDTGQDMGTSAPKNGGSGLAQDTGASDTDLARQALRDVVRDTAAPAAARAQAARTLLELEGQLGRFAAPPDPDKALSAMSGDELRAELARLRARMRAAPAADGS